MIIKNACIRAMTAVLEATVAYVAREEKYCFAITKTVESMMYLTSKDLVNSLS